MLTFFLFLVIKLESVGRNCSYFLCTDLKPGKADIRDMRVELDFLILRKQMLRPRSFDQIYRKRSLGFRGAQAQIRHLNVK